MRLTRHGFSRAIPALLAGVWLVQATADCVVSPFPAAAEAEPESCHVMKEWYPADTPDPAPRPPAQTCCELRGKSDVTFQDAARIDPPEQPVLAFVFPARVEALANDRAWVDAVEPHAQDPPRYLENSVLLI